MKPNLYKVFRRSHTTGAVVCHVKDSQGNIQKLDTYRHVVDHSPDGFEYGYGGSGPAQLALAILCHYLREDYSTIPEEVPNRILLADRIAERLHQDFKRVFIEIQNGDDPNGFTIAAVTINHWLKAPGPESLINEELQSTETS